MAEKRMEIVARAFGLDIGEEFYLLSESGVKEHRCRFTEEHMERLTAGEWGLSSGLLEGLLMGEYTVEQVEWKPKVGESYWTYCGKSWYVKQFKHRGTFESNLRVASSVAFRTKEEAYAARETAYELITGKKWEEENDVAKVG